MSDLPPLDQPQAYVVVGPNDQRGPYTMELLISEVLAGRLSDATPVWWPGLADWTTMGGHPGVAGELARRRGVMASAAPAWAEQPAPAAPPQPTQPADTYAAPGAEGPAEGELVDVEGAAGESDVVEVDVVEAEIVAPTGDGSSEVIEVDEVVLVDPAHQQAFAALVVRSAGRAEVQGRIDAVNEQLVDAVVAGVGSLGLRLAERVDVDRGAELRFDGDEGDLVMVSLGRAVAVRPDDLRDDHVPVTMSYRSGAGTTAADAGSGEHGDVVVAADEWTGQSTSTVSLFLGLGDYLDDQLRVDRDAVVRDVVATVAVLRSRLA